MYQGLWLSNSGEKAKKPNDESYLIAKKGTILSSQGDITLFWTKATGVNLESRLGEKEERNQLQRRAF